MGGDGCPEDSATSEFRYPVLQAGKKGVEIEPSICFSKDSSYKIKVDFRSNDGRRDSTTLLDSVSFFICFFIVLMFFCLQKRNYVTPNIYLPNDFLSAIKHTFPAIQKNSTISILRLFSRMVLSRFHQKQNLYFICISRT